MSRSIQDSSKTAVLEPNEPLPFAPYRELSNQELCDRITAAKQKLGPSLLILGHHYQQDLVSTEQARGR